MDKRTKLIPAYQLSEIEKHNPCPERWAKVKALIPMTLTLLQERVERRNG